jgi:hypothetical protein
MMEIVYFSKKEGGGEAGMMLRVTEQEAIQLIQSLSNQLLSGSPNAGRTEFFTKHGNYFSVAVHKEGV